MPELLLQGPGQTSTGGGGYWIPTLDTDTGYTTSPPTSSQLLQGISDSSTPLAPYRGQGFMRHLMQMLVYQNDTKCWSDSVGWAASE